MDLQRAKHRVRSLMRQVESVGLIRPVPAIRAMLRQSELYLEYANTYRKEQRFDEEEHVYWELAQVLEDFLRGVRSEGWELRGNPRASMRVQSLLFDKSRFTLKQAEAWIKRHKYFHLSTADETRNQWRFRQFQPKEAKACVFRTIRLASGIEAVVAR